MLVISLTVIAIMGIINFSKNLQQYAKLKNFYINYLHFDASNFENYIPKPKIEKPYIIILVIAYASLIVRLFLPLIAPLIVRLIVWLFHHI